MTNRSEAASGPRVSPAYALIRVGLIHIMASKGMPTNDIAAKLGVNRSYVIRLRGLSMEPQTPDEVRIADLAPEFGAALQRLGMGFALKPGFDTVLAGGDRSDRIEKGVGGGRPRGSSNGPKEVPALSPDAVQALEKAQKKVQKKLSKAQAAAGIDLVEPEPPLVPEPTPEPPAPKKKLGGAERKRLKKQREQEQQAALNLGAPPAPDTIL